MGEGAHYLGSLGAHWFPFVVPGQAASISGLGFFLSISLDASYILFPLTTDSLIFPFLPAFSSSALVNSPDSQHIVE